MADLSYVTTAAVERITASVSTPDFQNAAIAAYFPTSIFATRSRKYTSFAALAVDFPASGATVAVNAAGAAYFAQSPRPKSLTVLRLALATTRTFTLVPSAGNLLKYKLKVNGVEVIFTSDSSGSVAEAVTGLKDAIDALAVDNLTTTDNTTNLAISGAAGVYYTLELTGSRDDGQMTLQETSADPGIATDLTAVQVAEKAWYAFSIVDGGKTIVNAASVWAEANGKFFVPASQDSDVLTGSTSDLFSTLKAGTRERTLPFWHRAPGTFPSMALLARVLAAIPGTRKFYHKILAGITVSDLNDTEIANLVAKFGTYYVEYGSLNRTDGGKVSGNEWADVIIGADYYQSRAITRQADVILGDPDGLGADTRDIAKLQKEIQAVAEEALDNRFARLDFNTYPDLGYGLTVPTPDDVDPATRELDGLAIELKLLGGIKKTALTIRLVA